MLDRKGQRIAHSLEQPPERERRRVSYLRTVAIGFALSLIAGPSFATLSFDSLAKRWLVREVAGPNGFESNSKPFLYPQPSFPPFGGDPNDDPEDDPSLEGFTLPISGALEESVGFGSAVTLDYTLESNRIRFDYGQQMYGEGSSSPTIGTITRLEFELLFTAEERLAYHLDASFLGEGSSVEAYFYRINLARRSGGRLSPLAISTTRSFQGAPTPTVIDWNLNEESTFVGGSLAGVLEPGDSLSLSLFFESQFSAPIGDLFEGSGFIDISTRPIPEPGSAVLIGLGLGLLASGQNRKLS